MNAQRRVKHALETSNIKQEIFEKLKNDNKSVGVLDNLENTKENFSQDFYHKEKYNTKMMDIFNQKKNHKLNQARKKSRLDELNV